MNKYVLFVFYTIIIFIGGYVFAIKKDIKKEKVEVVKTEQISGEKITHEKIVYKDKRLTFVTNADGKGKAETTIEIPEKKYMVRYSILCTDNFMQNIAVSFNFYDDLYFETGLVMTTIPKGINMSIIYKF